MTPAIFGLSGPVLTPDERAFFADADPAGYILFGRNIENRAQLRALTDDLRSLHGRDRTFICIDQEGGRVARMKPPEWQPYPAGEAFDRLYEVSAITAMEAARCNALALGLDLAEAGITVDCWPVLDVRQAGAHDVIGDRALGFDPDRVASLGRSVLDGLREAGVAGVVKHLPGHGRAHADSHKELPTVAASAEELEVDIAPFRQLASISPIGMTGHIVFTAWDRDNPATLSPFVIEEIIRKRIGFAGLLLTDDLDMEALSGPVPERAARAIAAGCDIALNCWAKIPDMIGIARLLPEISAEARQRLDAALEWAANPPEHEGQAKAIAIRDDLLALAESEPEEIWPDGGL